jgi:hypothetical protein
VYAADNIIREQAADARTAKAFADSYETALAKADDDVKVLTVQLETCQAYIAELESKLANAPPAPNPVKLEVKVKALTEAEVAAVKAAADETIADLTEAYEAKLGRFKRKYDVATADREKMSKQLAYARLGNKKTKRDLFASYKAEDVLVDELHPIIALFDQNREQEQKALAALSKMLNARLAERAADTETAGSEGAGPSSA